MQIFLVTTLRMQARTLRMQASTPVLYSSPEPVISKVQSCDEPHRLMRPRRILWENEPPLRRGGTYILEKAKTRLWMLCLDMLAPPLQAAASRHKPLGHAWLLAAAGIVPTREITLDYQMGKQFYFRHTTNGPMGPVTLWFGSAPPKTYKRHHARVMGG